MNKRVQCCQKLTITKSYDLKSVWKVKLIEV